MELVLDILSPINMFVMLLIVLFMALTIRLKFRNLCIFKIIACSILILSYVIQLILCYLFEQQKGVMLAIGIIMMILLAFLIDSSITLESLKKEQSKKGKEEYDERKG